VEVTADMLNTQLHTQIERSIIPENSMILPFTVSEKMQNDFFYLSTPYLITGSGLLKIILTLL
jgi:hypothetical protein